MRNTNFPQKKKITCSDLNYSLWILHDPSLNVRKVWYFYNLLENMVTQALYIEQTRFSIFIYNTGERSGLWQCSLYICLAIFFYRLWLSVKLWNSIIKIAGVLQAKIYI